MNENCIKLLLDDAPASILGVTQDYSYKTAIHIFDNRRMEGRASFGAYIKYNRVQDKGNFDFITHALWVRNLEKRIRKDTLRPDDRDWLVGAYNWAYDFIEPLEDDGFIVRLGTYYARTPGKGTRMQPNKFAVMVLDKTETPVAVRVFDMTADSIFPDIKDSEKWKADAPSEQARWYSYARPAESDEDDEDEYELD
jgi:hypothetical protein